jgi:hypothetical protein
MRRHHSSLCLRVFVRDKSHPPRALMLRNLDSHKATKGKRLFFFRAMCHILCMKRSNVTLGENAFAAISAVEGLVLSDESRTRIDALRKTGLSNDLIRDAIKADLLTRKAA